MKKLFLSIILLAISYDHALAAVTCDQTFYGTLRAGGSYQFFDELTNETPNQVFVNLVEWEFLPKYNYGTNPTFSESQLVSDGHIWVPNETGRVAESTTYKIDAHPPVRANDNLIINYDVTYSQKVGNNWGSGVKHRECKYYQITWCGDGIKDTADGEVCDPADPTKSGWGSAGCDTSCKPINNPPENGVCSTTVTGPQDAPLTNGACNTGSVIEFRSTGTNPINYTWNCSGINGGNNSPVCRASYTPAPPAPKCDSAKTGHQSNPLLNGSCEVGTVKDFLDTKTGLRHDYTWKCENTTSVNCTADYTEPVPPATCDSLTVSRTTGPAPLSVDVSCTGRNVTSYKIVCAPGQEINSQNGRCTYSTANTYYPRCYVNTNITSDACEKTVTVTSVPVSFNLALKKYVEGNDAQDVANAYRNLKVNQNFQYTIEVTNKGEDTTVDETKVTDTLPTGVSLASVNGGTDWSCTKTGNSFTCTTQKRVAKGAKFPVITVNARTNTVGTFTNTATVTNPHSTPDLDDTDPAVIIVTGDFDLSVKKYVKGDDIFARVNPTEDYDYNIIVTNNGAGASTGVTTIRDILPSGVTLQSGKVPSGNGWTCTRASDRDFTCTYTGSIQSHQLYPTITVPASVRNLAFRPSAYVNYAYVYNQYEVIGKRCRTNGMMPNPNDGLDGSGNGATPERACDEDVRNFDAATVSPPNPNGFDLMLHKYVNDDDESSRPNANGSIVYTFVVRNLGILASSGTTTVTDTDFPTGITISQVETTQGIWSCTHTSTSFSCTTNAILQPDTDADKITVYAQAADSLTPGTYRNVACLSNPYDPHESAPYDPDKDQYKVNNCNPAEVIVVPPGTFDLTIVKKVGNNLTDGSLKDRNGTDEGNGEQNILVIGQGAPLVYTFDVKNLGPVTATGTTTVEDTLPEGISATQVSGNGWSCTITGNGNRSWKCTRTTDLSLGASFPTINLTANSSATALQGIYSNIATVSNPGDTNPTNNSDPANVKIVVTPTCGSLTANPPTNPNLPNTPITYTCAAVGYTGPVGNLEYNITCGGSDLGWSGSATRVCPLPGSYNSTQVTTCKIQDKTHPGVIFSGSLVGACRSEISTPNRDCENGCGPTYVGKTCANGIPTCGIFGRLDDCMANKDPSAQCYNMGPNGEGLTQCRAGNPQTCGGPPGGGRCGDGTLTSPEECDFGDNLNGAPGSECSRDCKITTITNPGSNPPTDIWMTIPTLSNARLGYSWLDGEPGKVLFHENNMILGQGTRAFTLADTVGFGIKTKYQKAFIIESDKLLCLSSTGSSLNTNELCTTFGQNRADGNFGVENICGKEYIIMGFGDYQIPVPGNCTPPLVYTGRTASYDNTITLFKGSKLYDVYSQSGRGGQVTLNSGFQGATKDTNGGLILSNGSLRYTPLISIPLVALDVKVSGALVGGTAGTVNRRIDAYIDAGNLVNLFLSGIKSNTTTTANTTTTSNNAIADLNVNTTTQGDRTAGTVSGLEAFAVNGNKNILSVKNGNLTIDSCGTNKTLFLDGVRTVIVENGDLIIKCNIIYANADASWAFIVKNGDIQIYNGTNGIPNIGAVTNLAGVYVGIDGYITSTGATTTQAILKIDGSMYGDANSLFNSRLYVRGTNAYEILTTGVVLSYSNRALVSPPPLLSSYLNNYSVTRVVK